jgi:RNA polymerase sigma-70 factor (ECF subfamily)
VAARYRAQSRQTRLAERRYEPLPAAGAEPRVESDPAEGLSKAQETAALRRALVGLPIVYREAVVLCDLQELSYQEAAEASGCAIGTIRSRLHRGRTMLTLAMKDRSDERTGTREGAQAVARRHRSAAG